MNSGFFRAWSNSVGKNYSFKQQHTFGIFPGLAEGEEDTLESCVCMYVFICTPHIYVYILTQPFYFNCIRLANWMVCKGHVCNPEDCVFYLFNSHNIWII